jgi:hypothetical protein
MTSVSGHLTSLVFGPEYNNWKYPPPEDLFHAEVHTIVDDVRRAPPQNFTANCIYRIRNLFPRTLPKKHGMRERFLYGQIVTAKGNI